MTLMFPMRKNRIADIISININSLFRQGKLYNPIEDHIKKKIDYIALQIARNIVSIFDFEKMQTTQAVWWS